MSAIFGSGKPKEKSGSRNHSAARMRPIARPSGTPTTMAMPRPSSARQSVSHSGPSIVVSATSAAQRTTISDTGGNT